MARARNIKPGFYLNEELASCSIMARFIFPGIWMLADREGRMEDRPLRIKAALLPYDHANVDELLDELEKAGMLQRYESGNTRYIQIINFKKHQTPHIKEQESTIPAPDMHSASTVQAPDNTNASTSVAPPDSLIPSSLIPELNNLSDQSLVVETLPSATPPATTKRGTRLPADWQLPLTWGEWAMSERQQWTADDVRACADRFRDYWISLSGQKATKTDWQATWRNWVRNEQATPHARGSPVDARSADRKRAIAELTGVPITELGGNQHERIEREVNPAPRLAFSLGG